MSSVTEKAKRRAAAKSGSQPKPKAPRKKKVATEEVSLSGLLVSASQLAEMFGVSHDHIRHMAQGGQIPPAVKPGKYDVYASVRAYVDFCKENAKQSKIEVDGKMMSKAELQAERIAMDLKRDRLQMLADTKSVVRSDLVIHRWKSRMIQIQNAVVNASGDLVDICFGEETARVAKKKVTEELKRILGAVKSPLEEEKGDIIDG